MWKSPMKILPVILRCLGSALGPIEIRQSLNKEELDWQLRLKGGEKVKDGCVKTILKGHSMGEKVAKGDSSL